MLSLRSSLHRMTDHKISSISKTVTTAPTTILQPKKKTAPSTRNSSKLLMTIIITITIKSVLCVCVCFLFSGFNYCMGGSEFRLDLVRFWANTFPVPQRSLVADYSSSFSPNLDPTPLIPPTANLPKPVNP